MKLALLGDPVGHSLSPTLHRAALAATGIAGTYETRRVDAEGMRRAVAEIRMGDLHGANVTMPHKRLAAELADRLQPMAARAQAANTLWRIDDSRGDGEAVTGETTDVAGVVTAWKTAGLPTTVPVLVLGAGGAAAAALLALEQLGTEIALSARTPARAKVLTASVGVAARVWPWATPLDGAVVVNCTPLGMRGEALPANVLDGAAALFDMAYGRHPTPAVLDAEERRLPFVAGEEMLLAQAARSFEIWTGVPAPTAAMRSALAAVRTADAAR